jgi:hypothetical protein
MRIAGPIGLLILLILLAAVVAGRLSSDRT